MSKLIVKIEDAKEGKIWYITKSDCVYKCPKCNREVEAKHEGISCPKCKCGAKMKFRWWADREDIEFDEI